MNYYVLAFYHFTHLPDPHAEVESHKRFFQSRDITSRIYISEHGINGQMSASIEDAQAYMEWLKAKGEFSNVKFKIHSHHEQVFPRQTVKYRKQLVALDEEIDLANAGEHVSPEQWKTMLENDSKRVLIDVRNEYEWKVGHFKGADLPPCDTFREFKDYADSLKDKVDAKNTPVMMYCTGGIRCELYSAVLKSKGFEKVYQLEGGVINYGLKQGSDHWLGKLFVFDDRLTIPISEEATPVIGQCHHCHQPADTYYNCANMDCNCLFICCKECALKFIGCCQDSCCDAERVRPFNKDQAHKPFRKRHHYTKEATDNK